MLNIYKADTQDQKKPKLQEKSTYIGAQEFLNFKYGNEPVDIMFPDGTAAKLIVANTGRIYFQVSSEG